LTFHHTYANINLTSIKHKKDMTEKAPSNNSNNEDPFAAFEADFAKDNNNSEDFALWEHETSDGEAVLSAELPTGDAAIEAARNRLNLSPAEAVSKQANRVAELVRTPKSQEAKDKPVTEDPAVSDRIASYRGDRISQQERDSFKYIRSADEAINGNVSDKKAVTPAAPVDMGTFFNNVPETNPPQGDRFRDIPGQTAETNEEAEDDNGPVYSNKLSNGLDRVATKMSGKGDKERFKGAVDRIDTLASRIDEEGVLEIAKSALRRFGTVALKEAKADVRNAKSIGAFFSAENIRKGTDKMDEQSRKGDGWLANQLKSFLTSANTRRTERKAKKAAHTAENNARLQQNEAYASYADNISASNKIAQDKAYESYADNIKTTEEREARELAEDEAEAYEINERYDMEAEAEIMNEQYDADKAAAEKRNRVSSGKLRKFGRGVMAYASGVHAAGMANVRATEKAEKIRTTQESLDQILPTAEKSE
jgi:hypothetical protein